MSQGAKQGGRLLVHLLGWSLGLAALAFILSRVDLGDVASLLRDLRPLPLAALCLLVLLVYAVKALRWTIILRGVKPIGFGPVFGYLVAGYFMNSFLPARMGDLLRLTPLARRHGIDLGAGVASTVVEKLFDIVSLLLLFLLAALLGAEALGIPLWFVAATALSGMALLLSMGPLLRLAERRKRSAPTMASRLGSWIGERARTFRGALVSLSPSRLLAVGGVSLVIWLCDALATAFGLGALGFGMDWQLALVLTLTVALAQLLPMAPLGLGTVDAVMVATCAAFGLSTESGVALAVLLRLASLFVTLAIGIPSFRYALSASAEKSDLADSTPGK